MGGRAALSALAAHPGRAKGLVLIDVPVGAPLQIDDQQKKQFLDFMEANYEQVASRMFGNMGRDTTQSKAIYTAFSQTPAATVKAYIREGFFSDGNKDAKALKVPVQYLFTSRAWKADRTSGATFKQFGWDDTSATARRIPDSGYWVMKDQPDTLAAIISDFATARLAAKK
jgi:pimeloyl-ACP methyl ester carboxylesterase